LQRARGLQWQTGCAPLMFANRTHYSSPCCPHCSQPTCSAKEAVGKAVLTASSAAWASFPDPATS
jgi:hypothetical protein